MDKIKNSNILIYITIFVLIIALTLQNNTIDMDYWARLIQGNVFWATGDILKYDPFSYTPTHIWLDHEWGSSVIFSLIQNSLGFKGILFTRAIIIFLILIFGLKTIQLTFKENSKLFKLLYFTIIITFALPTIVESGLRCHFFTFLFFTIFLYILEYSRIKEKNLILYILPIIMVFWINIHGGCVSGIGLIVLYIIGELLNKKDIKHYFIVLLICCATFFINPYGVDYVKFLLMATTMVRPYVTEWISPFAHPNPTFLLGFKIVSILNIITILFSIKEIKKDYTKYIILFVCAYLSFKYIKNAPFFIITSMILLYKNYYNILKTIIKDNTIALNIVIIAIISYSTYLIAKNPIMPILTQQPTRAIEFLRINNLAGNIFAPFDIGSYIIYKLYPNNLVYMDGRYEEVYYKETKELADSFFMVKDNWQEALTKYEKADYIILPSDALINDKMKELKEYTHIYNDGRYNIFSIKSKLKEIYYLPADNQDYYSKKAFETNIKVKK